MFSCVCVGVCVRVCMCMFVLLVQHKDSKYNTHTHTHTHTRTHTHAHTHTRTHTRTHAHTHARAHTHTHTHTHTRTHTRTHTHAHTHTHTHTHTRTHTHTHTHTHAHTVYTHAFLVVHNGLSLCCAGEVIQSPWLIGAISVHLILDRSQVLPPVVGNLVQWHVRMYLYILHCVWWGAVCVLSCVCKAASHHAAVENSNM